MSKKRQSKRRSAGSAGRRAGAPAAHQASRRSSAVDAAPPGPVTRRDEVLLAVFLALAFLVPLAFYLLTLAPGVTLEDSGELIAAAYGWGIPHQPGYPLWTLIAHAFTRLPFGEIAWRVNLMSALFSALASLFVAWSTLLIVDEARFGRRARPASCAPLGRRGGRSGGFASDVDSTSGPESGSDDNLTARRLLFPALSGWTGLLACCCALAGALLAGTARSAWEQSVITEVYGLNSAFVGLLVFLLVAWTRARSRRTRARLFWALCLGFGLALCNHSTALLLLPVFAVAVFAVEWRRRPGWRDSAIGIGVFALGLLPYLYLPLASRRDPPLDWGDPETWTNFWRSVRRSQYGLEGQEGIAGYWAQLEWFLTLLGQQWLPGVVLVVAVGGLALLFRRRLPFAWFAVLFLLVTGPVTTYVTNFPVDVQPELLKVDNQALVSVFYLPFYLMCGLLAGLGFWWGGEALAGLVSRRGTARSAVPVLVVASLVALAVPLASALRTLPAVDMSDYRFAEAYIDNVNAVVTPDALVMGNRDQWVFPLMYSSMVRGDNPGAMYVDQELLRRSWYIQMLRDHYPEQMGAIAPQADAFLEAVAPFEAGEPYSSDTIQRAYVAMINGLLDSFVAADREVFLTYRPEPDIAAGYQAEPLPGAWRLVDPKARLELTEAPLSSFDFAHLTDGTVPFDRNADYLRDYYGGLLQARGQLFEQIGRKEEAAQLNALGAELLQAP